MHRYKNLSQDSGVTSYKINNDSIIVEFTDGAQYVYSYDIPGKSKVEQMKELAINGKGLSTYISQTVKTSFAKKLK